MQKKELIINALKITAEIVIFILLVLAIIYLIRSDTGILNKIDEGTAQEKLNTAIKVFASTDGMKLEDAIERVEGFENLDIDRETGEYNVRIDGQDFLVISKEVVPEIVNKTEGEENGEEK